MSEEFLYRDSAMFAAKLVTFEKAGPERLHLIFDFDRTLTIPGTNGREDITSWHILSDHLPREGQQRYWEMFRQCRDLELEGGLDANQAAAWWSKTLDLFVEYKVELPQIERDFLARASIRPGTKELFDLCAKHNIPTVILSAGVKDVIELWARAYKIRPTIVLSTALKLGPDQRIEGWDKTSLVHSLNKREIGHPELAKIRAERPMVILIGDSLHDGAMAEGTNRVVRIFIDNAGAEHLHDDILESFDVILRTKSLLPVQQLVERLVA